MAGVYSWLRCSFSRTLKSASLPSTGNHLHTQEDEEELYGVTAQLIDFITSFTLDTFKNFSLQDEDDDASPTASGNVRKNLSDWQQRHAILVLSKVKELSQLRFKLCPGYLKERDFWRIYFTLVKSILAEYELRAVRLNKLKQMNLEENENASSASACEVELSEAKQVTI